MQLEKKFIYYWIWTRKVELKAVMLVTTLWIITYDDNSMIVTDLECCWQNHHVGDLFRYAGDFGNQHLNLVSNIFYLSPTHLVSNIHHQHRCNRCALKFLLIISKLSNYKKPKSILLTEWKYISKFKPVQRILHFGVVARTIGHFHRFLRFGQFWTIIWNVSEFLSRGNFESRENVKKRFSISKVAW